VRKYRAEKNGHIEKIIGDVAQRDRYFGNPEFESIQ
jgi:hypothetical protein